MNTKTQLLPKLYFSYGQFLVYDASVRLPGCLWNDAHVAQGFARRASVACFSTLLEFGDATVYCTQGPFEPSDGYERVIAVPFTALTGKVIVDGPDEHDRARFFHVPAGDYELVAAQQAISDDEEIVDLFVRALQEPMPKSRVLVADEALNPPKVLLETADVAGQ